MSKFTSNTYFTAWHTCASKDRDGPANFLPFFQFSYSFHTPALSPELHQPHYPSTDSAKK